MDMTPLQPPFSAYYRGTSSSPPSSPCSCTADSSPPSSPGPYTLDLDEASMGDCEGDVYEEDGPGEGEGVRATPGRGDAKGKGRATDDASPAHPFAASTRAVKRPPRYDKDLVRVKVKRGPRERDDGPGGGQSFIVRPKVGPNDRFDPFAGAAVGRGVTYAQDAYLHDICPAPDTDADMDVDGFDPSQSVIRSYDAEHALWEETIARAVDDTECSIELNGLGLTYIPPKISDLSLRFVLPNQTSSNREDMRRRTISKSSSSIVFGGSNLGVRENEFQLYITNNRIRTLPNELFNFDALVVLSLRSNMLTELNPQICQLHNLRELNVASNQLRYLPSEIMDMKLTSLAVDPNPFAVNPCAAAGLSIDRWFGPVERRHRVVPLVELALRVLLAPVPDSNGTRNLMPPTTRRIQPKTVLQSFYDLPLPTDYEISPALRETLSSCVPGSIASLLSPNATPQSSPEGQRPSQRIERRACISVCPSPAHLLLGSGEQYREPIYVSHAEERLSWEKEIAGQKVGGDLGIAVRWRGCSAGCLDHLEQPVDASAGQGEEGWLTTGMEVDTELLHSEFVPVVEQFTSDGFEFDLSD